jgi:small conductance mechanosensitive channel
MAKESSAVAGLPLTLAQNQFSTPSPITPTNRVLRQGHIEYTNVRFRGQFLFPVTAQIDLSQANGAGSQGLTSNAVTLRAQAVENKLETLLKALLQAQRVSPDTLEVNVGTVNKQVVILASHPPQFDQEGVVTVTALDAQLAQVSDPVTLAQDRAKIIRAALIRAWQEAQPAARKAQRNRAVGIGIGTIALSILMFVLHRILRRRFGHLQQRQAALTKTDTDPASLAAEVPEAESAQMLKARFYLRQQINLNRAVRGLLGLGQFGVWLWGTSSILNRFPETRVLAAWILSFPTQILIISGVLFFAAKLIQEIIHRSLQGSAKSGTLTDQDDPRVLLRTSTLETVLYGITHVMAWVIGVIYLLVWWQVNLGAILTGAGIFGAALGLIFQNLLKDWVNGMLIIFEDQYAVGDVVDINGTVGFVEKMSIRSTQLRSAGGRISTVPHNQVGTVHNLTKDWSRVDFTIEITHQANPTEAMAIMKQVAVEMQRDPDWQDDILEPTSLIGVGNVSAIGTQIEMWIKTKRMRQWDVAREFRRRLKLAFDQHGIAIGMPRQTVHLESEGQAPAFSLVNYRSLE